MIKWLIGEESGQGVVEYALVAALIAIVAVASMSAVGNELKTKYTTVSDTLSNN